MIKIKREILEQIQRSSVEDDRYLAKLMRRIDPKIKKVIQYLANLDMSLQDICTLFCSHCANGLDKYNVENENGTVEEFFKKIELENESIADYITICDFSQANRLVTLIILYRVFESELEIRKLQ